MHTACAQRPYCTVYAHLMFTGNVTIYTAMINNFIQTGNRPYRLIRFVQGWGHSICNIGASKCYRPFISSMLLVRGSRQNEYAVTNTNLLFTYKYYINTRILYMSILLLYVFREIKKLLLIIFVKKK